MNSQEKKVYTAVEIREMANRFGHLASNPDCLSVRRPKDQVGNKWGYDAEAESIVQEMLLQAAEMNDRCVQMRNKYIPYYGQNDGEVDAIIDTVDFVQTGKEN